MKTVVIAVLSMLSLAAFAWGLMEYSGKNKSNSRLSASEVRLTETQRSLDEKTSAISSIQLGLDTALQERDALKAKVVASDRQLAAYKQRIADAELAMAALESRQKLADQQPVIRSGNSIVFPTLMSALGIPLMTNAEFRTLFGRKLTFKSETALLAFDVDQVHPGALRQLAIDADAAKAKQVEMDKALAERRVADAIVVKQKYDRDVALLAEQARQAEVQAKLDEEFRKQRVAENQAQQSLDSERIRAQADMKMSDAMLIDSVRPLP